MVVVGTFISELVMTPATPCCYFISLAVLVFIVDIIVALVLGMTRARVSPIHMADPELTFQEWT